MSLFRATGQRDGELTQYTLMKGCTTPFSVQPRRSSSPLMAVVAEETVSSSHEEWRREASDSPSACGWVSRTASIFLRPNFGKNSSAEERKDFPQSTRMVLHKRNKEVSDRRHGLKSVETARAGLLSGQ